jgi:hypothetical protein
MARSLYRSVTYGLEASLALADTVARSGGRTDVDTLASALSYSGVRNGAFLTRLANARLFGLVAGRSGQVVLTDRGRRCLSADPAVHSAALAEACWAVPLFHRVLEDASDRQLGDVDELATVLETRFGEDSSKSRTTARVLLESAGRAGLLRAGRVDLSLVTGPVTNFTDSESDPGRAFVPPVGLWRSPRSRRAKRHDRPAADQGGATMDEGTSPRGAEQPPDEGDLWIDEGSSPRGRTNHRRTGIVLGVAACVALIGVPVGLLAASGPGPAPQKTSAPHLTRGVAERQVISALSATTSSGSFNVTYEFDPPTPPTVATTTTSTTMPSCHVVVVSPNNGSAGGVAGVSGVAGEGQPPGTPPTAMECTASSAAGGPSQSVAVTGQGTIDTDPFAMLAVSNVSGLGKITLRDNGTNVWEFGGADYGLAPGSSETGPGASLSGFAGLVEGTLGPRQGALAMGGLSSPTGYLDLDQSMITGADQTGTGTVDGVPVTVYEISIDPAQGANVPGINAEQAKAITAAAAILKQQGYTGTTVQVSVDASGYIRQTRSVAHFADGSTTSSESTFSDFGCAGTVLMPGQTGATAPPAGCVSPDTGVAPTTTTTSTVPPSTTVPSTAVSPTTSSPTTSTSVTEPPSSTTSTSSTTLPPTTTTTQGTTPTSG